MQPPVKLRGHHLLCILSYIGKGYTAEFTDHFDALVTRINRGAAIEIISGTDDICASLRHGAEIKCDHARICRKESVRQRDRLALRDIARALRLPRLKTGDHLKLTPTKTRYLRGLFAHAGIRRACIACPWRDTCSAIAATGFKGTRLF